ncbi:MAG: DUF1015 domain-containing protein [bacterium]
MARIRPFAALLPPAELAARISCPPYDVVTTAEARQFIKNDPRSYMRVIRAEAEGREDVDHYAREVYDRARENFSLFRREGWLQAWPRPGIFVYRLREGEHVQTGVVACCSVEDYETGVICRHENTRPDKEHDRMQHTLALSAHPEAVLLAYRGQHVIDEWMKAVCGSQPLFDFKAEDGVQHTLWPGRNFTSGKKSGDSSRLDRDESAMLDDVIKAFAQVPRLYIADGHHRSASARRASEALRVQSTHHTGSEEYNFFPAALFPAEQLRILAYNRVLRPVAPWQPEEFLRRLRSEFYLMDDTYSAPRRKGEFCVYFSGHWHSFALPPEATSDPVALLDLSRLQKRLLEPFFGIGDQRTDARIDFIGGKNSVAELERQVDRGQAQLGLSLFPPTLEELFAVSDRGELMPPKSTWFEPKLRSGLFIHTF